MRDKFTVGVTIVTIPSIQWGKRLGGIGYDWQVDFGEDNISCLIDSSKDAGLNDENIGWDLSGIESGFMIINGRLKRRVLILSLKKERNWSAECITGGICWDEFDQCKTLSKECHRDLESKKLSNKDKNNFVWALFSTEACRYNCFLYSSLSDSFLVLRQLHSNCRLLHLSFNKWVVNQGFKVHSGCF